MKGWLDVLRKDKKFIFRVVSDAQKAIDYLTLVKRICLAKDFNSLPHSLKWGFALFIF